MLRYCIFGLLGAKLDGSRTYAVLKNALQEAELENPEQYLFFNCGTLLILCQRKRKLSML